jgi:mono/diheme cytochrome c family protein
LGQRYSIDPLAEALAEGLYTGHPDMPEFVFEISDGRNPGVSAIYTSAGNEQSGDKMKIGSTAWTLLIAAVLLDSSAGLAADIAHGQQLARRWCEGCHLVAADQRQAATEAPPFASIASRRDFDQNRLAFFLLDPHPKMPDLSLTRTDASDLAGYIASLAN